MRDFLVDEVRRLDILPHSGVLVTGVSGGPDSLALLHVLHRLQNETGYRLHAATLDHGLRGQAGADDVRFVVEVCEAWGIPVSSGAVDASALAREWRKGIEEAARLARYRFLAAVAAETGAAHVAVGHHADDQAETVLMHIIRGAGLRGLGSMTMRSPLPGDPRYTLLRPFLNVTRAQIEAYCRDHGLRPRHDLTNEDTTLFRNRLRHEVLPLLRQLNPQVTRVLGQLGDVAAVDNAYLEAALHAGVLPHVQRDGPALVIPRDIFTQLHPAMQRRLIAWAAAELIDDPRKEAGYVPIVTAVQVAVHGVTGARAELPGGIQLRVAYDKLIIGPADYAPQLLTPLLPENARIDVVIPGMTPIGDGWRLFASETPPADRQAAARLHIPIGARVALRTRRPGDRFAPLGMAGHRQKIKAWMIDRKVPLEIRDRVPLLEVDGQIAAILFGDRWPIGQQFAVGDMTDRIVYFWADKAFS